MSLRHFAGILSIGVMVIAPDVAGGQDYPSKPIRIVTATPGSGSDFVARLIAQGIAAPLGQPVIVENRPSNLTGDTARKALPDGYTLLVEGNSFWLGPLVQKMPYDVLRDFTPVTIVLLAPNVLVAHPSVAANSVTELIALAKAKPGQLNYGSSSTGSSQQLALELLKFMAGVDIVEVSYKGVVATVMGVIAGEIQLVSAQASIVGPHIKSGKLKALGVTTPKPSPLFPDLPTIASAGLPGYELVTRTGLFAAGKPPRPIIQRLNQEIVRTLNTSETKEKFFNAGVEAVGNTPEDFVAIIKSDMVKMGKLIKDAKIRTH